MQKVDFSIIFDTRFLRRKVIALIATLGHARAKCWAFLPLSLFWYKNSCYHFQLHYGKGMFQEIGSGPLDTQILKCFCSKKNRSTKLLFPFGLIASRTILQMNSVLIAFLSDLVPSRLMSVLSSANCEILAFCPFESSIPRQICSWRTLRASISTANANRRELNGHPWWTPLDTLKY